MAVTENSYTGNGSTTNYSFTFPYLKSSDIQVQVDAVVQATNTWSLANATTVQFNTAPANNSKIKILRDTTVDNLTATFYAGSAIKSEDLNDNFTQNLYVTQEIGNRSFENTGTSTMIGNLNMGEDTTIIFEGATDNAHETTLTVADPTADRTITLPNVTGTVVTTGDTATVTATMLAANSVDSSELVDGSVDLSHMSANSVDSDQYVDGSIDLAHMSANSVDSDQYVDGSIDLIHMSANSVDSDQYVDGSIDLAHMSANSVDSDQYVDGSIDHVHLANDIIDGDNIIDDAIASEHIQNNAINSGDFIADNVVDSEHIQQGAVDLEHMSANSVDSDQYVDGSIDRVHLSADIIDSTKIEDNAVGTEHIADAELTTLAGMQSGTASILAGNTALTATLAEINSVVDGKAPQTTISDDDTKYPTSGAVVDYVAAQLAPIGGLEVIADDESFPETQPAAGVVISIADAGGLVVNGSGVSTTGDTITSNATVTINGINSAFHSKTVDPGVSFMVSSTGSGQVYNFHKATLKEADILSLSGDINDFAERYRVSADPDNLPNKDEGDLVYDTAADKMKVYDSSTSAWKEVTSTGDFKYLFLCPAGGTGAPSFPGATYDLREASNSGSTASITSAAQLLVSINGVIQKANTGTSAPSEGFALVDANTIIFGANITASDNVFIIQFGSALSITTPGNNTVTEAAIQTNVVSEEKLKINNAPASGKFLTTDGSGNLNWSNEAGTWTGSTIYSTGSALGGGTTDAAKLDANGVTLSATSSGPCELRFLGSTTGDYVAFKSDGSFSGTTTFVLPDGDGSADQVLKTDGSGNLDWTDVSATPTTTRGDIIYRGASADQRLAKGTEGQFLKIGANDPEWADVATTKAGGAIYENSNTISETHTLTANTNGMSAGPVTVNSGITLTIPSGATYTVV